MGSNLKRDELHVQSSVEIFCFNTPLACMHNSGHYSVPIVMHKRCTLKDGFHLLRNHNWSCDQYDLVKIELTELKAQQVHLF